jgi:hypothetical protein
MPEHKKTSDRKPYPKFRISRTAKVPNHLFSIVEGFILLLHDTTPKKIKEVIERYPVPRGKKTILCLNITNSLKFNRLMNYE